MGMMKSGFFEMHGQGFPDSSCPSGKNKDRDCVNTPTDKLGFLPIHEERAGNDTDPRSGALQNSKGEE